MLETTQQVEIEEITIYGKWPVVHDRRAFYSHLPREIFSLIFEYLDETMIMLVIRLVCSEWNEIVENELLFGPLSLFSDEIFSSDQNIVSNNNNNNGKQI